MIETIELLPIKLPNKQNTKHPQSLNPTFTLKKEPVTNLNVLSTKQFLPSISPLGLYTPLKTKKKSQSLKQKLFEHPLNSFRDSSIFNLQDDWSKEGCEQLFNSVEQFLDSQLKREKSCKRRCNEIIKVRNIENTRKLIENAIKDFDEKINLNLLVKSKETASKANSSLSVSDSTNYRALIAEEILRINSKCSRCKEKNRRFEEALFDSPLEIIKGKNIKKTIQNCNHHKNMTSFYSPQHCQKQNLIDKPSCKNLNKGPAIKQELKKKNFCLISQNKKLISRKNVV